MMSTTSGLTFGEIQQKRYKSFSRMADEKAKQHVDIVKYIEGIARTAGVDLTDWDARAIFGTGTGNELELDRGKVNELFFNEMERRQQAQPAPTTPADVLSQSQIDAITAVEAQVVANQVSQYEAQRNSHANQAQEYYRNYENYLKAASEQELLRLRLTGSRSLLQDQIRAIATSDFWTLAGIDTVKKIVRFKTRNSVTISEKNPALGIDMSVNVGSFLAEYSIGEARIRVRKDKNNLDVDGHIHPHINHDGSVCWGDAATAAQKAVARVSIVEPFALLAAVLTGYNPASPYRHLIRFYDIRIMPEEQARIDAMAQQYEQTQRQMVQATMGRSVVLDSIPNPPPSSPVPTPAPTPAMETIIVGPELATATPAAEPPTAVPPPEAIPAATTITTVDLAF